MTSNVEIFSRYLAECPIVAILRGITPDEVVMVGQALMSAGIRIIEIPLNSPEPLESIYRLAQSVGSDALVGAGTVLTANEVAKVKAAGGQLIVSPNTDLEVITATLEARMVSSPGYFTPTEAFAAIQAGAHAIKLFPAEAASPAVLKAHRAVLPSNFPLLVVGGVTAVDVPAWISAGASGFGLGSALYRPGQPAEQARNQAMRFIDVLAQRDDG